MSGHGNIWTTRATLLAETLDKPAPSGRIASESDLARALQALVDPLDHSEVWLALAIMSASIPADDVVLEVAREAEFDHGRALAAAVVERTDPRTAARVVVVPPPETVVVEATLTLHVPYQTGIQRVVRETVSRWLQRPDTVAVSFTADKSALRQISAFEESALLARRPIRVWEREAPAGHPKVVFVPWKCTFLTAEVLMEPAYAARGRSIAAFARGRTAAIVYDCSPVTLSETRTDWRTDPFVFYLSAMASFDQLAGISAATTEEFRGYRHALSAVGSDGPAVDNVPLPVDIAPASPAVLAEATARYSLPGLPVVLVVGSREPRKNHLAVLHAAELAWRRGHRFSLLFMGGRAWEEGPFHDQVARLRRDGRSIDILTGLSDEEISAAYQLARFSVFPSISEGFGLPVAESLALGTPVITSNFGSMKEIADGGGALQIDPRDDHALAEAMERLLVDDDLLEALRVQARNRPPRTWDDYARETWDLLVDGVGSERAGSPDE